MGNPRFICAVVSK